jgi:hypothetical protein
VLGQHPSASGRRAELRQRLGYRPDERVCIVTVGGSSVGTPLIRRILQSLADRMRRMPDLRMILVAGPRIDTALAGRAGRRRAAPPSCPTSTASRRLRPRLVQGGLTTCMELAARHAVPFFPLRNHSSRTSTSPIASSATRRPAHGLRDRDSRGRSPTAMVAGAALFPRVQAGRSGWRGRAARLLATMI